MRPQYVLGAKGIKRKKTYFFIADRSRSSLLELEITLKLGIYALFRF